MSHLYFIRKIQDLTNCPSILVNDLGFLVSGAKMIEDATDSMDEFEKAIRHDYRSCSQPFNHSGMYHCTMIQIATSEAIFNAHESYINHPESKSDDMDMYFEQAMYFTQEQAIQHLNEDEYVKLVLGCRVIYSYIARAMFKYSALDKMYKKLDELKSKKDTGLLGMTCSFMSQGYNKDITQVGIDHDNSFAVFKDLEGFAHAKGNMFWHVANDIKEWSAAENVRIFSDVNNLVASLDPAVELKQ